MWCEKLTNFAYTVIVLLLLRVLFCNGTCKKHRQLPSQWYICLYCIYVSDEHIADLKVYHLFWDIHNIKIFQCSNVDNCTNKVCWLCLCSLGHIVNFDHFPWGVSTCIQRSDHILGLLAHRWSHSITTTTRPVQDGTAHWLWTQLKG